MEEEKPTLGSVLRAKREAVRFTLRTVEEVTGVSNAYLSQLENGKVLKPSANILLKLSELYKIDFRYLLSLAGIVENEQEQGKSFNELVFSKEVLTKEEADELSQYLKFIRLRDSKKL
jgi:transcriptional regulator with XRE-family HTH domain